MCQACDNMALYDDEDDDYDSDYWPGETLTGEVEVPEKKFTSGDLLKIKGNHEVGTFKVTWTGEAGGRWYYDLGDVDQKLRYAMEFIPEELLELAPKVYEVGDVVNKNGLYLAFAGIGTGWVPVVSFIAGREGGWNYDVPANLPVLANVKRVVG